MANAVATKIGNPEMSQVAPMPEFSNQFASSVKHRDLVRKTPAVNACNHHAPGPRPWSDDDEVGRRIRGRPLARLPVNDFVAGEKLPSDLTIRIKTNHLLPVRNRIDRVVNEDRFPAAIAIEVGKDTVIEARNPLIITGVHLRGKPMVPEFSTVVSKH